MGGPEYVPRVPAPPWSTPRGLDSVTARWLAEGRVQACTAAHRALPGRDADTVPLPEVLPEALRRALVERGVTRLYRHQQQAILAALQGRHVLVATPTASGKSLCFHAPILTRLAEEPTARALYLYPTKALSRDQEAGLRELARAAGVRAPAVVFDGDTPGDARRSAREQGRAILTNPDMLHASILPNHLRWAPFFQGLRYVVLDELHVYRGVFGSHFAHVLARLQRVARLHGAEPTFLSASATIGNPLEHAARLLGVAPASIELVDRSGAPETEREVFLYNPPVVNEELGVRASALKQAVGLAAELIRARVPTLVFGPSRSSVETMLKYLRAECGDVVGPDALQAYRGGYLPERRRAVEQGLREGRVLGVVATNALELGIDIGDLEAVVSVGYPGSVAALWQRFGRAGRRGSRSVAVLVCSSAAVDQYLARVPEALFDAPIEEARTDASNVEIVLQHLKCAAFEAPFVVGEAADARLAATASASASAPREAYCGLDEHDTREALGYLAGHGLLHETAGRFHWAGEAFPATQVSLRNVGWTNFVIIDVERGESLAEMDWRSAHTMLHEQAIYQHDADQYQVERLDFENHKAFVRRVEPDYFTTAITERSVVVLDERRRGRLGAATTGYGDIKVLEKVTGYKKVKFFTHENAGYGDVFLPELELHTVAFWLTLPEEFVAALDLPRAAVVDGLRGLGVALKAIAALALMCEPMDLGSTLGDGAGPDEPAARLPGPAATRRTGGLNPTLFFFDAVPGGVGLTERLFERAEDLVVRALALVGGCTCRAGCPGCVGSDALDLPLGVARKRVAARVGEALLRSL